MSKIRVHALAKELGLTSKDLIEKLNKLKIEVVNHMSTIDSNQADLIKKSLNKKDDYKEANKTSQVKREFVKKDRLENGYRNKNERTGSPKKDSDNKAYMRDSQNKNSTIEKNKNTKSDNNKKFDKNRKNSFQKDEKNPRNEKTNQIRQRDLKNKNGKKNFSKAKDTTAPEVKPSRSEDSKKNNKKFYKKEKSHNDSKFLDGAKSKSQSKKKVNEQEEYKLRDLTKKRPKKRLKSQKKKEDAAPEPGTPIVIELPIVIKDFAEKIFVPVGQVITKLIGLGVMASQNESIDEDTAILLAEELGVEIEIAEPEEEVSIEEKMGLDYEDNEKDLKPRPPVVTVMGHVDHGKTSLLDVIKSSHVTASEAGGITQHIGAYTVRVNGKIITFLDTPGHEAFTSMRLRGTLITDIAILVVAADDGVMPQTIEAISHARSANVPIIVAINKIDKPTANIDRVKQELVENNLIPEDWGGDVITIPVSAKTKEGIDELLEMIQLLAEMKELKANPNRMAVGTVIEAKLDKGKGPMATVLIQKGTLRFGDSVVSGFASGRIRAMNDDKQKPIKKAGPSMPAVILGLDTVPNAGDTIYAVEDEKTARTIAETNREQIRENRINQGSKVSLDNLFEKMKEEGMKELNLIVKADVKGSVEALLQSLLKLSNEEVKINIIHSGVGGINESDVTLASASGAIIIGFNVRPNINALEMSRSEEVDVRTYRVIYDIINDVEAAVKGMLEPDIVEEILGRCEVRQTFKLPNNSIVAGVYVINGKILRKSKIKILRDDIVLHEGDIGSLRRFKDDVKEIATGYEGGLVIEDFNDLRVGDVLECFILKEVQKA